MVGLAGLEPATLSLKVRCFCQLSYNPNKYGCLDTTRTCSPHLRRVLPYPLGYEAVEIGGNGGSRIPKSLGS